MKRILPIVLAVVMILSTCLFAGCDKKDQQPETYEMAVKVRFVYFSDRVIRYAVYDPDTSSFYLSVVKGGGSCLLKITSVRIVSPVHESIAQYNQWHDPTEMYAISGEISFESALDGKVESIKTENLCSVFIDQCGIYTFSWTIKGNASWANNLNEREIKLYIEVLDS